MQMKLLTNCKMETDNSCMILENYTLIWKISREVSISLQSSLLLTGLDESTETKVTIINFQYKFWKETF